MADTWQGYSETVAGLIWEGRVSKDLFSADSFFGPYQELVHALHDKKSKEEIIDLVGMDAIHAAMAAAQNVNGLGKTTDWGKLLLISQIREQEAENLEKCAKDLRRGKSISSLRLVESAGKLEHASNELVPASEVTPHEVPFMDTGWDMLDEHLGGMPKTGLISLSGSPGVGKTSFLLKQAALFVRRYEKRKVAIFSLEMLKEEAVMRLKEIMPNLNQDELSRILICDEMMTIEQISIAAARIQDLGEVGIDFADQLVSGEIDESKMGVVYKGSASLAKRLKIPVWLLGQYNRQYAGGLPRPRHVRYTSLSEALSWLILMIYNPGASFNEEKTNKVLPIVAGKGYLLEWKSRGGFRTHKGPGAIQMSWAGERGWVGKNTKWFSLSKMGDDDEDDG